MRNMMGLTLDLIGTYLCRWFQIVLFVCCSLALRQFFEVLFSIIGGRRHSFTSIWLFRNLLELLLIDATLLFFWLNGEIDIVLCPPERFGSAIRNGYDRRNGLTINTQEDMDIWSTKKKFSMEMDSCCALFGRLSFLGHGSIAFQKSSVDMATTVPGQGFPRRAFPSLGFDLFLSHGALWLVRDGSFRMGSISCRMANLTLIAWPRQEWWKGLRYG